MNQHWAFLQSVQQYVAKHPEAGAYVSDYVAAGIADALKETQHRAADMEVVANMAMNTRLFKGNEKFLAEKLKKWNGNSALKWDDVIERLEK